MGRWGWIIRVGVITCMSGPILAQDASTDGLDPPSTAAVGAPQEAAQSKNIVIQVPLIAFDRDRIFTESTIGRDLEAKIEALRTALVAENDTIYTTLEAEEKELSILKDTLSSEAFSVRADAFDAKVIAIRAEQKVKSETVQQAYDLGVRDFEQSLNTVLTEIAQEVRAVAVFERKQIYLMSGSIDISLEAIKRLNARSTENAVQSDDATLQDAPTVPAEQ